MKKSTALVLAMTFALLMLLGCKEKQSEPSSPDTPESVVNDICGNTYKCVKIGSQVWMAENMRCEKYDTQSEHAGATITKYTSKNPDSETSGPYCVDASKKELWDSDEYAINLSSEQIEKLGYLYSWSAAVSLENESASQSQAIPFDDNRQGICPNGWHVPTDAEWSTLEDFVGSNAGEKLKATSGWYSDGNGTDAYSFAALPPSYAYGSSVCGVGNYTGFWTATPDDNSNAFNRSLQYAEDILDSYVNSKHYAFSVRCVMN